MSSVSWKIHAMRRRVPSASAERWSGTPGSGTRTGGTGAAAVLESHGKDRWVGASARYRRHGLRRPRWCIRYLPRSWAGEGQAAGKTKVLLLQRRRARRPGRDRSRCSRLVRQRSACRRPRRISACYASRRQVWAGTTSSRLLLLDLRAYKWDRLLLDLHIPLLLRLLRWRTPRVRRRRRKARGKDLYAAQLRRRSGSGGVKNHRRVHLDRNGRGCGCGASKTWGGSITIKLPV